MLWRIEPVHIDSLINIARISASMGVWKQGLQLVFSKQKYVWLFFLLSAFLLPFYSVLTDIVVLSPLSINPNLKLFEVGLILFISIFAALGFTIAAFQLAELHAASRKSIGGSILGAGAGGTVLATFASACTVCQPIWLFWLGLGSTSAFLVDYSAYVLLASLAILIYSVNAGLIAVVNGCAIKRRKH